MKSLKILVVATMSAWLLAACGEKKIDGSSQEAAKASIQDIRESLPGDEKEKFSNAIKVIYLSKFDGLNLMEIANVNSDELLNKTSNELDGLTADEVITKADSYVVKRREKEKEQALTDIKNLEEKKKRAQEADNEIKRFEVVSSSFRKIEEKYSYRERPIIDLKVSNGTESAISRVYFRGTLASPGRSIPWVRDTFNYQIAGGLEPGESASWSLAPNQFSNWGETEVPSDAVLTVEVLKLDGPDGKALWDASGLNESEEEKLEALKAKYDS
ncbi:DUF6694 family lipoprotein [Kushneria phyllosphaerae]|uniref:Lipoprotein n=1 Tax=Kushneria phyllosphaerae TaxID=2100822 RepID=A0A2R8CIU2_9GAMM|nr:DUF6694 family lipoprotein [Kushneria phyllosphaerae]SPJ32828.1 hypothetical protein KSP9073_00829 [Kushneria phyllosphaerae]